VEIMHMTNKDMRRPGRGAVAYPLRVAAHEDAAAELRERDFGVRG
jgi:hypothetical protein